MFGFDELNFIKLRGKNMLSRLLSWVFLQEEKLNNGKNKGFDGLG